MEFHDIPEQIASCTLPSVTDLSSEEKKIVEILGGQR